MLMSVLRSQNGAVLFLAMFAMACSSLTGGEVASAPGTDVQDVGGIPYYLTRPHFQIEQKTLHEGKPALGTNAIVIDAVPDPARHFEVGMHSGWFTSDSFSLALAEDGRVVSVSAKSVDQTARVVAELAKLAAEVAKTVLAFSEPGPTEVKGEFEYARANGIIDEATREAAANAVDVLSGNVTMGAPLDPEQLGIWANVSARVRKGLIEGTSSLPGIPQRFAEVDEITASPDHDPEAPGLADLEDEIVQRAERIQRLDNFAAVLAKSIPKPAAEHVDSLTKAFQQALGRYVRSTDANREANWKLLLAAQQQLVAARERTLAAHEAVDPQALVQRRDELINYLTTALPKQPTGKHSKAYMELSGELGKLRTTIQSLLGKQAEAEASPVLATQVTRRIDDQVAIDYQRDRLSCEILEERLKLAKARVLYTDTEAVVIVHPE
jgi:Skp family chaperone for outer membrane proteins